MTEVVLFQRWNGSSWVSVDVSRLKRTVYDSGFPELMVWLDLGSLSQFSTGDEVRVIIDNNRFFQGRLISAGKVNNQGEAQLKARSLGYEPAQAEVSFSLTSTNNKAVVTQSFSGSGFSVSIPGAATSYGIGAYGVDDRRSSVWGEMTENYDYRLLFDGSTTAVYEPRGWRDSGITLNTSNDPNMILSWEKEKDDTLVTKVECIGVDASGNIIKAVAGTGDRFIRVQVSYAKTVGELQDVADSLLNTTLEDGGVVEAQWFKEDILVNQVFGLVDVPRDIDGGFVVLKQEDFWPQRVTLLTLGSDEDVNGMRSFRKRDEETREGRAVLFEGDVESVDGNVASHQHNPFDTGHDHTDPTTTSTTSDFRSDFNFNKNQATGNINVNVTVPSPTGGVENVLITVHACLARDNNASYLGHNIRIRNTTIATNYLLETNVVQVGASVTTSIMVNRINDDILGGDNIQFSLLDVNSLSQIGEVTCSVQALPRHTHNIPSHLVDEDNAVVFDVARSPSFSGTADVEKAVNVRRG